MSRGLPIRFADFSGGVNTRDAAYQISDNQARDALNVISTPIAKIRKRDGCSTFNSQSQTTALALFATAATPAPYLLAHVTITGTGAIMSFTTAGSNNTITPISVSSTAPYVFANFPTVSSQGPVFAMNGVDKARFWTGATASTAMGDWTSATGNLPNGKYMLARNNRIWVAGIGGYQTSGSSTVNAGYLPLGGTAVTDPGSTLVFSAIGDARTWPAANVVQFDPNDGDAITGLGAFGPYLFVFKRHKCWVVYDLDTGANRQLSANIGCIAANSIAEGPQNPGRPELTGCFFLTADRTVCVTNGQTIHEVSQLISPTLKAVTSPATASGVVHEDRYYLSTSTTQTYDLDLQTGGWWPHSVGTVQWARWDDNSTPGVAVLYAGAPDTATPSTLRLAKMFRSGVTQDFGAEYAAQWIGPHNTDVLYRRRFVPAPYVRKRVRAVRIDGLGKVNFTATRDFDSSTDVTHTAIFGAGPFTRITQAQVNTLGVARAWSYTLASDVSQTGTWEVDGFTSFITERTT